MIWICGLQGMEKDERRCVIEYDAGEARKVKVRSSGLSAQEELAFRQDVEEVGKLDIASAGRSSFHAK